jgi:hypothetical protein
VAISGAHASKYYLSLPPEATNSNDATSGLFLRATIFFSPHIVKASNIIIASNNDTVSTNATHFNLSPPPDMMISSDAAVGSLARATIFFPPHVIVASNIVVAVNHNVVYTDVTLMMVTLSLPQRCLMESTSLPSLKT